MASPNDDAAVRTPATALEAEAEAGAGASATNATPENVALGEKEQEQTNVGDHPGEPERSAAKIAIIMFALGVRIFRHQRTAPPQKGDEKGISARMVLRPTLEHSIRT